MPRVKTFGEVDERSYQQLLRCAEQGTAAVLCADHHPGYSQPIGGAVAYPDHISPSGVGFDIACVAAGTPVTTRDGYFVPIEAVSPVEAVVGFHRGNVRRVAPSYGAVARGRKPTLSVELANERRIEATADHRLLTPRGWQPVEALEENDLVACSPYVGLPFEPYGGEPPALVRLLGYVNGDGHLTKDGKRISIYTTSRADAAAVVRDLRSLGYRPRVYQRTRYPRRRDEICVDVGSRALHARLGALGAPVGKKRWRLDQTPWLLEAPRWVRAQYVSGFASAEMVTPTLVDGRIASLAVKQAGDDAAAAEHFAMLLGSLGFLASVAHSGPARGARRDYVVQILGGEEAQLRFLAEVGFAYARAKRVAAAAVASVAWARAALIRAREDARAEALHMWVGGMKIRDIVSRVSAEYGVPRGFVHHAIYDDRGSTRRGLNVVLEPATFGEAAWVPVADVFSVGDRDVWDVVTGDPAESFVANGIVVHNCGNKAAKTPLKAADVDVPRVMDEIVRRISFGVGRANNERVDHPVIDEIAKAPFEPQRKLLKLAEEQLGTVGSGNHYVDLFEDEEGFLWIGVHFGSRGFGHRTASGFLALAQGKQFGEHASEGGMDAPPVLFPVDSELGQAYIEAMTLAGEYAYAGRDWVVGKVLEILGTHAAEEVHNHHNFAWREQHFGDDVWVVRKGCTPIRPGQRSFVGGSMGDISVILEGVEGEEARDALYSTVHGAGRVMSRTQAAGKRRWVRDKRSGRRVQTTIKPGLIDFESVKADLRARGIELRGGGADEAPAVYKRLEEVLGYHAGSIRVVHTLRPLGVAMAGLDEYDPYKD